jgi:DNA-binding NtrC family response regulator
MAAPMEFKILIVDDDTNLLSVLKNFFAEEGYAIATCSNGLEAIRKCGEQDYDLVITDIMMPGATGLDVLREVRKVEPQIMVVLITGFASLESAVKAIREGAYDYITKPFKLEEISIVVKNALDRIRLVRENQRLINELRKAYEQLRILKKIFGTEADVLSAGEQPAGNQGTTLIASNLVPFHFMTQHGSDRSNFISDLERMSQLRHQGFISEREFELCKLRLFQNLKT